MSIRIYALENVFSWSCDKGYLKILCSRGRLQDNLCLLVSRLYLCTGVLALQMKGCAARARDIRLNQLRLVVTVTLSNYILRPLEIARTCLILPMIPISVNNLIIHTNIMGIRFYVRFSTCP